MTQEEIINTITTCSGMAGITEFERLSKDYFLKWFWYNIQYNSESSKKQGLELIEYLKICCTLCCALFQYYQNYNND